VAVTEYSEETLALLRLSLVPGIGPCTLRSLLEYFHSAAGALAASKEKLAEVVGVGSKTLAALRQAQVSRAHEQVLEWCDRAGVGLLSWDEPAYPSDLRELADAPPILYQRGRLQACDGMAVAIVGARHATQYGTRHAGRIARDLARAGVTVVSGLARGIDAAAHRGALEAGGRTIGVLGGGLRHLYPPEHAGLAGEIASAGALLSEYPPDVQPRGSMFPQRNRIISGLSLGVLVVEAADRSGSLITARHAGEQGRAVFALPGPVHSRVSKGCHRLIRDGAMLVTCGDDILELLGPAARPIPTEAGLHVHQPGELLLNDQERIVLEAIGSEATSIDAVTRNCGLPVHRVLSTVSVLEMRHLIRRLSGQYVARI
jgi:DNA processing protein